MALSIERLEILLLIAAVVAMLARRARVPYTVVLVLAGIGLALFSIVPEIALTKDLIFSAFLPPLIFEAAFYIPWPELRKDLPVIAMYAIVGVAVSAAITMIGMQKLAGWEFGPSLLFGVLIAATDPVSVIATFKEAGAHGRLRLLVESESLFNDGTAAVGFAVALAVVQGGEMTAAQIGGSLLVSILGGVVCGSVVAGAALFLAGHTDDHLIEITFTTVAAYGSFLLAERLHLSGVLATMTAGLLIGNYGHLGSITDKGREAVGSFWEYMAFVVNSLVFLLIGMRLAHQDYGVLILPVIIAVVLVLVGRAAGVYLCSVLFLRSSRRVDIRHQHILWWGGLRGALALALALGLPESVPRRLEITTLAFAVVAFSVLVQGLTIMPLMKRLGELGDARASR